MSFWYVFLSLPSCRASSHSFWVPSPFSTPRRPNIFRLWPRSCVGWVRSNLLSNFQLKIIPSSNMGFFVHRSLLLLLGLCRLLFLPPFRPTYISSVCLPQLLPPSPVWLLTQVCPSWFGPACVSLIPISSHSSAWQAWQPVTSLIGPSLTGRRVKINCPSRRRC